MPDGETSVIGAPTGGGTWILRLAVEASGQRWRYVVDAYDAPHRIRMHARQSWVTSVDTISVTADGTGSIATYDADLRLHGPLRLGDPILALVFRRIGDRAAEGLRERLQGERLD